MSALHLYCDESGGADRASEAFLVAAVALAPHAAARLIKSFHKAARLPKGKEVKGHLLSLEQRRVLFDLLAREGEALSVVVAAQRSDAVGGWALGSLAEVEVYGHLLGEACERLIVPGSAVNVMPDGGRYPRPRLAELRITLQERLRARDAGRMNIEFASSAATPGVQVADVIANTVYRLHATGHTAEEVAALQAMLTPLQSSGRLSLHDLELPGVRPGWADQQKGRPKAAYVGVSTSRR